MALLTPRLTATSFAMLPRLLCLCATVILLGRISTGSSGYTVASIKAKVCIYHGMPLSGRHSSLQIKLFSATVEDGDLLL
jgi:hypothetical protein